MPRTRPADRDLGPLLRSADPETLTEALLPLARHVVRQQVRLCDPHLVESAAHDGVLAVLRARETFAGRARARTWLTTIFRRAAIDAARRQQRRFDRFVHVPIEVLAESGGPRLRHEPDPDLVRIADRVLVAAVPNARWRRAFLLHHDPDTRLEVPAIAVLLGVDDATARSYVSRAKRAICRWLRDAEVH